MKIDPVPASKKTVAPVWREMPANVTEPAGPVWLKTVIRDLLMAKLTAPNDSFPVRAALDNWVIAPPFN